VALRLVFVHGIGGLRNADTERTTWLAALAEGARRAGHTGTAGRLLGASGDVEVVVANYSDAFVPAGAQGGASVEGLEGGDIVLVEQMLDDLIDEQLAQAEDPHIRDVFALAAQELRPDGTPQGGGEVVRRLLDAATTILSLGPLARSGQWLSGRLMLRHLAQVVRYLSRSEIVDGRTLDERIRGVVRAAIGPGPAVVVAHSLGSIVAFEALHEPGAAVPLLVTLGSPLGLRTVVWPRLRPQPPATPERVRSWLNCWDRDDVILARPRLEASVLPSSTGVRPESRRVDSDGAWVHTATKYLAHPEVGGRVAEALEEHIRATAP
jgi:hypothetical protein